MAKIAVVTGSSAGVGRAIARAFAEAGYDVGLLARGEERLRQAEAELTGLGVLACAVPTDVADAGRGRSGRIRHTNALGPIDVWVNNAMATIFAPPRHRSHVSRRCSRNDGRAQADAGAQHRRIIQTGLALSYRAIPLQSVYCGAKYAIRGFTDSLRSELLHDRLNIHLTMVHLPAMNTPQFDWAQQDELSGTAGAADLSTGGGRARLRLRGRASPSRIWVGLSTVMSFSGTGLRRPCSIGIWRATAIQPNSRMSASLRTRLITCSHRHRVLGRAWPVRCACANQQLGALDQLAQRRPRGGYAGSGSVRALITALSDHGRLLK